MEGWKQAQPSDSLIKGKWWEMYNDPALNALEEQVAISNQNVLQAEASSAPPGRQCESRAPRFFRPLAARRLLQTPVPLREERR